MAFVEMLNNLINGKMLRQMYAVGKLDKNLFFSPGVLPKKMKISINDLEVNN